MIKIKRVFIRSFSISFVVAVCFFSGLFGIAKAYENTRRIGFGENKKAVAIEEDGLRILDFTIKNKSK